MNNNELPRYVLTCSGVHPDVYGVIVRPQNEKYDKTTTTLDDSVEKEVIDILNTPSAFSGQIRNYGDVFEKQVLLQELGSADEDRTVYHCFSLVCNEYDQIVLYMRTWKFLKVWVNMKLFTVTNGDHIFFLQLHKGENIFIIETSSATPTNSFILRLEPYVSIPTDNLQCCGIETFYMPDKNSRLYCQRYQLNPGDPFVFIIFPNDTIHVDPKHEVEYEVKDHFSGEILQTGQLHFFERFIIETSGILCQDTDKLNCLDVCFHAQCRNGKTYSFSHPLYPYDMIEPMDNMIEYVERIITRPDKYRVNDSDVLCLTVHLETIRKYSRYSSLSMEAYRCIADTLYGVDQGHHISDTYTQPGLHTIYMKNKLDGSATSYRVSVPRGYNASQKYPLMVYFSTGMLTDYSKFFEDKNVIAVDIFPLGFTLGSYIGEAYILELLQDIKERYSIDETRVWAAGHSNGAYAAWSLALAYPHLFAGILTVSGGMETELIPNISNNTIINVSSEDEYGYKRGFEQAHPYLLKMQKATEICAPNHTHNSLAYFMLNNRTTQLLHESRLNMYPNEIHFTTRRNRHCRSYWVEIHGISFGEKQAHIHAHVKDDIVYVDLSNTPGVTVTVPPHVVNRAYSVVINGEVRFSYTDGSPLHHYIQKDNTFVEVESKPQISNIHKGNGLLDIYLKPVRIITTTSNEAEIACAKAFSSPRTNCIVPVLAIKYPIFPLETLEECCRTDSNIIIIDCGQDANALLEVIRKSAPIQMDESGYTYKGERVVGEYCIMQIFNSPQDSNHSILYVRTNNPSLLRKNILTRQPVFPIYASGYHEYWNNDAVIFFDKKYYRIFENGMDMETC